MEDEIAIKGKSGLDILMTDELVPNPLGISYNCIFLSVIYVR